MAWALSSGYIFHQSTSAAMMSLIESPVHGILLTGLKGGGKSTVARLLVSGLLGVDELSADAYSNHPYVRIITSVEGKAIPIETIRELQHFLSLKIPGKDSAGTITRVVVIEDAHLMTTEAQNALLKTLEEPPAGTALILTSQTLDAMLPTIQSRIRQLPVRAPSREQIASYFGDKGYSSQVIDRALLISGGLPGMTHALLTEDESHPLVVATIHARGILQSKTYERLLLVETLSKQKELCLDVLYVLGRMSRMALMKAESVAAADRWRRVLKASYEAERQMKRSVQAKLVLTNLMLAI